MSLFKTRQFWSTVCDSNEEFDIGSLKICRLNSNDDFIVIGSLLGILRIFKPSTDLKDDNTICAYKPSDLCIEKNLNFPILQVEVGRLVSGSPLEQIAILHPRSFAVYSFTSKSGAAEHGNQNMINMLYEHKLRRAASNLRVGPFGGSQNRDFIVVQSLDGMFSFFEQETFVFCCFLPNFLLPGPFTYCKRTDSFIICGSNLKIESFSYKTLSTAGQNTNENDTSGLKFEPNWDFNLSEVVIDVHCLHDGFSKESFIVILGERNLYCLSDNGKMKFMKRLDFLPSCFCTYILGDKIMCLIISETCTLLVYENTTLKWSAQLPILPSAIARANFNNLKGVLVFLSEEGFLNCSYLGTEPILFSAPPLVNQELNYEHAEAELATLNKIIRSTYNNDVKLTNQNADRELSVTIVVNPHLEECVYAHNLQVSENVMMCSVTVNIMPHAVFEEVSVCVNVQKPLRVMPQNDYYEHLTDSTKFDCYVYLSEETEIPSLDFEVIISSITTLGVPRVIKTTTILPIKLVLKSHPVMKDNSIKITLNSNENPVPLHTLFPEFNGENSLDITSNSVCFTNVTDTGAPVTILQAKSSQRYRLQSDSIAALNLCVQELTGRLNNYHVNNNNFKITFTSTLPITYLIQFLNEHFEYRRKVNFLQNELIQLGAQFRIIQKRLISKFKDKNPTPLTNLDMLLSDTYKQTVEITSNLEKAHGDLSKSQINLSCTLQLILNLLNLMDDINHSDLLKNVLSPHIYDIDGQNWEDTLDASLCYLLRTILAKSDKDKLRAAHTSYEEIKELSKLEKHLTQVLERVSKKGGISDVHVEETNEHDKKEEETVLLPIGSRLAESSSRALSARKSLLRRRQKVSD